jgi:molybdopterin-binding protein
MFDTHADYGFNPFRTSKGIVTVKMHWPTDEQWVAQYKRRKVFQKQLGRGAQEIEVDTSDADLALYEEIRFEESPDLTSAEATNAIDLLRKCTVTDVRLGDVEAEVDLVIPTGAVTHTLRIPSAAEVRDLNKTTRLIQLQYGRQEIRANLDAAARLWDGCNGKGGTGYANGVPNIHKDAAVRAVIDAIDRELTSKYDANF